MEGGPIRPFRPKTPALKALFRSRRNRAET
jgi:hypothetical protein